MSNVYMSNVQCAMCNVQCAMCNVQCAMCNVQCVYVYVYMYMCICVYVYMCICVYVYMYVCICICVYVYMYMCICVHLKEFILLRKRISNPNKNCDSTFHHKNVIVYDELTSSHWWVLSFQVEVRIVSCNNSLYRKKAKERNRSNK